MEYSSARKKMRCPSVRQWLLLLCCGLSLLLLTSSINIIRHSQGDAEAEAIKRDLIHSAVSLDDTFQPNNMGVCEGRRWPADLPPLYIITPTYPRAEQVAELTRTGQTLLHVDALVWIVAEDTAKPTQAILDYLKTAGLCYVYLRAPMPTKYKLKKNKPRGVANRNAGLTWIRQNAKKGGVIYFADDDNTYSIKLFTEIRGTKKVSMFPVGLVTKLGVSSPIVRNGHVTGYYDGWISNRRFPVDMAGFAVNVDHFLSCKDAQMPFVVGREETKFLEKLNIKDSDIEPLANNCTNILVWHTRTQKNAAASGPPKEINIVESNIQTLSKKLWKGKS